MLISSRYVIWLQAFLTVVLSEGEVLLLVRALALHYINQLHELSDSLVLSQTCLSSLANQRNRLDGTCKHHCFIILPLQITTLGRSFPIDPNLLEVRLAKLLLWSSANFCPSAFLAIALMLILLSSSHYLRVAGKSFLIVFCFIHVEEPMQLQVLWLIADFVYFATTEQSRYSSSSSFSATMQVRSM